MPDQPPIQVRQGRVSYLPIFKLLGDVPGSREGCPTGFSLPLTNAARNFLRPLLENHIHRNARTRQPVEINL